MLTIVIPAKNEADGISEVLSGIECARVELNTEVEVIVVDDGSEDATSIIAEQHGAIVLKHPHNLGYGAALKTGIEHAGGEAVLILDADTTYPTEKIADLWDVFVSQGFDMVVAAREGDVYRGSLVKSWLRWVLRKIVEWCAERNIPDINSGMRVFCRKECLRHLPHLCDTFSFTTSLTLAFMMNGKFVKYIPIPYDERIGVSRVNLLADSMKTLVYILRAIIYYNPLKIFIILSLMLLIFSAVNIFMAIVMGVKTGFLMAVGAIFTAILVFVLGLVADLLHQIMKK